jgi:glycosyltransferase involved in cell wall biosynthesis
MKILHIIPSISSLRGGPSQAVLEMVKALQECGVNAEILTTNDDGNNLLDIPLCKRVIYHDVPVWFFPRFSPSYYPLREFAFSWEFTQWLWCNIQYYELLHVHAIFSYPSTIAMAIARHQNVPYINRPLGQLCEWSLQQGKLKKNIYLKLIEKVNLVSAKTLHLTAKREQRELNLLNWNLSSFVLPHGLNMPIKLANAREKLHQMLSIPLKTPIILFLSRLHTKKGLDYLIPALSKLHHQNFVFVLAGSGDPNYELEIERLLKVNNLDDRTYKLGFVSGEKKTLCLQGADLYALTSHSENFGISVLESLASRTPTLVTTGVALSDLVKEQNFGWVVDLEIEEITASIQEFLDNPAMAKEKGDRAAHYVAENYAWEKIALNLKSIYENILRL